MNEEREIDLVDMIAEVLKHWRGCIVAVLIGALVLGGFSYLRANMSFNKQYNSYQSALDKLNSGEIAEDEAMNAIGLNSAGTGLKDSEKYAVDNTLYYDDLYADALAFEQKSPWMKFDSSDVPMVKVSFRIDADGDEAYAIEQAYEAAFLPAAISQEIQKKLGIEENLSEFVTYSVPSISSEQGVCCFAISCMCPDESMCGAIGDVIKEYMLNMSTGMVESVGTHQLNVLGISVGNTQNSDFITQRQNLRAKTISYRNEVVKALNGYNDAQLSYFYANSVSGIQNEDGVLDEPDKQDASEIIEARMNELAGSKNLFSAKKTLIGAVAALFLYCLIIAGKYILDGKLKSSDSFDSMVGFAQLGKVTTKDMPKFFIDKWVYMLRYRTQRVFSEEKAVAIVATNIAVNAKKKDVEQVSIIGCGLENKAKEICLQIVKLLNEEHQIKTDMLSDIIYDQKAMQSVSDSQSIVFLETVGNTRYMELDNEIKAINQLGLKILGGVIVD